jgi:hypothetical protein
MLSESAFISLSLFVFRDCKQSKCIWALLSWASA